MFDITHEDIKAILDTVVLSRDPLVFRMIPAKEKKKYIILCMIIHYFEKDKQYSEKEINDILKPIFEDYVMIRRYLIDYQFMSRTTDGKAYWLITDLSEFERFDIKKMV
ncbi:MAG: DUF2087 domain-containing protein [Acholeplasmataceae bacterium]|nr:DUF2087 domain-containing protein [Acholeplasmataceae bacterium]